MSCESLLVLEEGWLVHQKRVVNKLPIKTLQSIHLVEVKRIVCCVLTGGLNKRSSTKSFAIGEVLLEGKSAPLTHSHRGKASMIVAMPDAGVDSNSAGELTAWRPRNGAVQHGASEVEPWGCSTLVQPRPKIPDRLICEATGKISQSGSRAAGVRRDAETSAGQCCLEKW